MTTFRSLTIAVVLAAALLSAGLGTRGLNEPDEGRYASIAWNMYSSGNWLVPCYFGRAHYDKPPLTYWAMAAAYGLLGVNETAARLPSALAAFLTVILTWDIVRRFHGPEAALAAALILLTIPIFIVMARVADPNMLLTFWITLSIWAYTLNRSINRPWTLWVFYLAMGFAFLTKGPVGPTITILAILGIRWARPPDLPPRPLLNIPAIMTSLAIGLSWYLVVIALQPRLVPFFLGHELADRVLTHVHHRSEPLWFYVPVILAGTLPWLPILLTSVSRNLDDLRHRYITALSAAWFMLPLILFSLSASKLPSYILPLTPPLAILSGPLAAACRSRLAKIQVATIVLISLLLPVVLAAYGRMHYQWIIRPPIWGTAIPLLAAAVVLTWFAWHSHGYKCILAATLILALPYTLVNRMLTRHETRLGSHSSIRQLARVAQQVRPADLPVLCFRRHPKAVFFYIHRPIFHDDNVIHPDIEGESLCLRKRRFNENRDVFDWLKRGRPAIYLTQPRHVPRLRAASKIPLHLLYSDPRHVLLLAAPPPPGNSVGAASH